MATEKKFKKEKELVGELDSQVKDIRSQLTEQLRLLDQKLEMQLAMIAEIQEFYRRRAEVEKEYSDKLDRLVKNTYMKHKNEKQKREQWPLFSTYTCWQTLLSTTKKISKDHAALAKLYSTQVVVQLTDLVDDVIRIYRRCREIGIECHDEVIKVLNELYSTMKTYHIYHSEACQAENKMRYVEAQLTKAVTESKRGGSKKIKAFEKKLEGRQMKYNEAKLRALKARNDYLLTIDSANAAVQRYYVDDLSDLMDCMDLGYHHSLVQTMTLHQSADENLVKSLQGVVALMHNSVSNINARNDKQNYIDNNSSVFSLPKKFEFQPFRGDEMNYISAEGVIEEELVQRHQQLSSRLQPLRLENDEVWKTMETTEQAITESITCLQTDVTDWFNEDKVDSKSLQEGLARQHMHRSETEDYYVEKFRYYIIGNNLIARLHAKHSSISKALQDHENIAKTTLLPMKSKKRRIGRTPVIGQPKLFGGNLEEYIDSTGIEIPIIIQSCIRIVNLYGMHHQGIFRVSGAQVEINEFKASFERGEDPLMDIVDSKDINSVAGVLKLYLRELQEPLFPPHLFDEFIAASNYFSEGESVSTSIERIKELLNTMPRSILIVMRYLFAFLHHLSEYSDENMMDPYNLAVCFGPTLLPIPGDRDQVHYHANVNELIKNIIQHHEELFPNDGGPVYKKIITLAEEAERDGDLSDEEMDIYASDDAVGCMSPPLFTPVPEWSPPPSPRSDLDGTDAIALYDFKGRTSRELSFRKGDSLILYNLVSDDWYEGLHKGKEGLVPAKYVKSRTRSDRSDASAETDQRKIERKPVIDADARRSAESLPVKADRLSSDDMDKSLSQPNINVIADRKHSLDSSSPSSDSHSVISDSVISEDMMDPETGSMEKLESLPTRESVHRESGRVEDGTEGSTEALSADIDTALAEVMSGLESIEIQQKQDKKKKSVKDPKHTPDLVLDLPITSSPGSSSPQELRSDPESPTSSLSAAETFAKSNQSTIKKGSSLPRGAGQGDEVEEKGGPKVKRSVSSSGASIKERQKRFSNSGEVPMHSHFEERARSASPSMICMPENLPSVRQTREILEATLTLTQPNSPPAREATPTKPRPAQKPQVLRKPTLPGAKSPQLARKAPST